MSWPEQRDLIDKLIMESEDAIQGLKFLAANEEGDKEDIYRMIRYQEELHRKLRDMRVYWNPYPGRP